jgi:hypothetical protein
VAQGRLKEVVQNKEMICICLASGGQNNYEISNEAQTAWKKTKEKKERSTEEITFCSLIGTEAEEIVPIFTYSVQSNNKGLLYVEVTTD